jgi:hypothetical protein
MSPITRLALVAGLVVASSVTLVTCGGSTPDPVHIASGDEAASAFANASVSIVSLDTVLRLAVVGDSVVMALSEDFRQSVTAKIETGAGDRSGLGKVIASAVGAAVSQAVGITVTVPATSVRDLRYENGELRFDVDGGTQVNFTSKDSSGAPQQGSGGRFSEADALEFMDAVRAVQQRLGMR